MSAITVEQESLQLQSLGGSLAMAELGGRSADVGDRPTCLIITCSNHISCGLLLKSAWITYQLFECYTIDIAE